MSRALIIFLTFFACTQPKPVEVIKDAVYSKADSILIVQKLNEFKSQTDLTLIDIAQSFIGTEYAAKTLDKDTVERVVVNTHQFDCTTFIENCLALELSSNVGDAKFSIFVNNLKSIRYRNGDLNNYSSRLHYFTEWILDQEQKGLLKNITHELGGVLRSVPIDFMSNHISAYPQLLAHPELVNAIKETEKQISGIYYYIPKDEIPAFDTLLIDGMIIGFTTQIKGLDFVHTGFVIRKNGKAHLLHASSDVGEVTISELSISDYIQQNKFQSGIVVLQTTKFN